MRESRRGRAPRRTPPSGTKSSLATLVARAPTNRGHRSWGGRMGEREDPGGEVGGRVARLRARLTRSIRSPGADGAAALLAALRDYVRAAREAGLGARW